MQQSPDFCCPCGGFLGWKQIRLGGKRLSKSYGDLRLLGDMQSKGWAWEADSPSPIPRAQQNHEESNPIPTPGSAPIERLPPEILGKPCFIPSLSSSDASLKC